MHHPAHSHLWTSHHPMRAHRSSTHSHSSYASTGNERRRSSRIPHPLLSHSSSPHSHSSHAASPPLPSNPSELRTAERALWNPVHLPVSHLCVGHPERTPIDLIQEHPGVDEGEAVLDSSMALLPEPRIRRNFLLIVEHILVRVESINQREHQIVHRNFVHMSFLRLPLPRLFQRGHPQRARQPLISKPLHHIPHLPSTRPSSEP